MLVDGLASPLLALEDAQLFQFLEIFRGSLALGNTGIYEELNLAIRLGEYEFYEFLGINLGGEFGAAARQGLVEQVADGEDPAVTELRAAALAIGALKTHVLHDIVARHYLKYVSV